MTYGSTGKLLRVDLTSGMITVENIPDDLYRLYPGGKALAGYYLLHEMPAHVDPFGPDNVLIVMNGLLTGSPVATATRYTVTARSPLTLGYGESEAGGFWGPELKMAGFEGIIIKGISQQPVYLWIQEGQAELRPASHLWGKTPLEVQNGIRSELNDGKIRVLQTGPAGEKLVRMAAITNELRHYNGRNGLGAVFGSKKLRAIAVRGRQRYLTLAHNAEALGELGRKLAKEVQTHPHSSDLQRRGTPGLVEGLNAGGILPTLNFRKGAFENVDNIKWEAYEKEIFTARRSCYACAVRCKREVAVDGQMSEYGGPEYETVAAFGSNCGQDDIHIIAKANELCNIYVLDTISTGATIAFAMECFEHGLIGLEDTGGIDLRFGNTDDMLKMIELIGTRQGIGNLLAEGSKRAAEVIGGDARYFAMQVKGQELAMHEPRGKFNVGMGYAISEIGADHLVVAHDTMMMNPESISFKSASVFGIHEAQPPRLYNEEKMRQFFILESWVSLEKVTGLCFFGPAPRSFIQPEDVLKAIEYATGWSLSIAEALEIGERATNLARTYNVREGFSRQDDTLPERFFQPLEAGALTGQAIPRSDFEQALTQLYRFKGWDVETGTPTRQRLESLSLGWAADLIEQSEPAQ
jgi:aldehyde:ferredoxin oxidoreductase